VELLLLSIPTAAAKIGVSAGTLAKIERSGDIGELTATQVTRAAELYDVSEGYLRGENFETIRPRSK
jgi:transcriptional regulator with XRE-family HTH domain